MAGFVLFLCIKDFNTPWYACHMNIKIPPFVGFFVVLVGIYVTYHIDQHGFTLSSCNYTAEAVSMPENLKNTTLTLERDTVVFRGKIIQNCDPLLANIENELVSASMVKRYELDGQLEYLAQDRSTETIPYGKKFTIDQIVLQTKHGISTIDSGPGPIKYFVLKDETGQKYLVAGIYLGDRTDGTGVIFTYVDSDDNNLKILERN